MNCNSILMFFHLNLKFFEEQKYAFYLLFILRLKVSISLKKKNYFWNNQFCHETCEWIYRLFFFFAFVLIQCHNSNNKTSNRKVCALVHTEMYQTISTDPFSMLFSFRFWFFFFFAFYFQNLARFYVNIGWNWRFSFSRLPTLWKYMNKSNNNNRNMNACLTDDWVNNENNFRCDSFMSVLYDVQRIKKKKLKTQ